MFKKIIVLTLEEYKANWPVPNSSNQQEQDVQLQMFIDDATNQIDNLCGGKLFRDFPNLDPIKDEVVIYKLQRAVGDLTLLLDQTGKMYYDGASSGGGNASFSLATRSANSKIEWKRQDIIKNLVEAGFYSNVRIEQDDYDPSCDFIYESTTSEKQAEFVKWLSGFFLRVDGSNTYNDTLLNFPKTCNINNSGDIIGSEVVDKNTQQFRKPLLKGYDIVDYTPIYSENAKKVYDTQDGDYKYLSDYSVEYFGGLTKQQIYNAIYASGVVWNSEINYKKDWIVQVVNELNNLEFYICLVDNINQYPINNPNYWKKVETQQIDLNILLDQVKPYIDAQLDEKLPKEVEKQLQNLPQYSVVSEGDGEIIQFNTQQDYETYKQTMGVDDSYFENVDTPQYVTQSDLETTNQNVANNTSQINSLNTKVETKQNKIIINKYKLRDIYYGVAYKTFSSVSGATNNIGGETNGLFSVISTTLTPKPNAIYSIQTIGDIGRVGDAMWFKAIQLSVYSSVDSVNICLSKLYDSHFDDDYFRDNIYIVETIIGE